MSVSNRRKTVVVDVGGVKVGSQRPIVVQSMTNTDTADIPGTVEGNPVFVYHDAFNRNQGNKQ